ncbi:hypothetical protein dcmb_1045 [Dehalococcoides mccartyi DCMB5]|nr:hypothetical protein dcmb_1045 [Dehalococcoides mccartyi DCMB5]
MIGLKGTEIRCKTGAVPPTVSGKPPASKAPCFRYLPFRWLRKTGAELKRFSPLLFLGGGCFL